MPTPQGTQHIIDVLLKARVIDPVQARSALGRWDQWGGHIMQMVAELGIASEESMADALSRAFKVPRINLGEAPKDGFALARLDAKTCEERVIFPVTLRDRVLTLAVADPSDIEMLDFIGGKTRLRITPVLSTVSDIKRSISWHYKHVGRPPEARATTSSPDVPRVNDGYATMEIEHITASLVEPPKPSAQPLRPPPAPEPVVTFSAEDMQRLEVLRLNQEKTRWVVSVVRDLLVEKRLLPPGSVKFGGW